MTLRHALGYAMFSAPFIFLLGIMVTEAGWETVLKLFGIVAVIVLYLAISVYLITGGGPE